jgi:tripartite-type tricarboxylate transporter receptor subunit TctC
VAFKGDSGQLPQVMSGELPVATVAVSSIFGRDLRVLAVFGNKRHRAYPNTPAVTELGYPKIPQGFNGVFVPKGVPKPVMDTLEQTCGQIVRTPSFVSVVEKLNQTVEYLPGAEFAKALKEDYDFKGRLIREMNLQQN